MGYQRLGEAYPAQLLCSSRGHGMASDSHGLWSDKDRACVGLRDLSHAFGRRSERSHAPCQRGVGHRPALDVVSRYGCQTSSGTSARTPSRHMQAVGACRQVCAHRTTWAHSWLRARRAPEKRYPGRVWQWLQPTRTAVCGAGMGMGLGGWYQTAMPSTACGRERPYTAPVTDLVTWIPLDENVQRHLSGYCGSP